MKKGVLNHLAIIMDGNRRWAKNNKLHAMKGHDVGYDKTKEVGQWCLERGIKILTVWAFSTDNWQRPKKEVDFLLNLIVRGIKDDLLFWNNLGVRIKFLGSRIGLAKEIIKSMQVAEEFTKGNSKAIFYVAFNYGGRAEIIDVINKIITAKVEAVDEKSFNQYLYDPAFTEPDLIIRTSGEIRTSGFLPWQSVYSEWYFCDHLWPDFTQTDLDLAIESFNNRQRRYGK